MIKYLKEEAKRAKKAGLTKSQFLIAEIIKILYYLIGCSICLYGFYIFYCLGVYLENI